MFNRSWQGQCVRAFWRPFLGQRGLRAQVHDLCQEASRLRLPGSCNSTNVCHLACLPPPHPHGHLGHLDCRNQAGGMGGVGGLGGVETLGSGLAPFPGESLLHFLGGSLDPTFTGQTHSRTAPWVAGEATLLPCSSALRTTVGGGCWRESEMRQGQKERGSRPGLWVTEDLETEVGKWGKHTRIASVSYFR